MESESIVSSCLQLMGNQAYDSGSWEWEQGLAAHEGVK